MSMFYVIDLHSIVMKSINWSIHLCVDKKMALHCSCAFMAVISWLMSETSKSMPFKDQSIFCNTTEYIDHYFLYIQLSVSRYWQGPFQ